MSAYSSTDPGQQSVKEIEREIAAERDRVSQTVDALQQQLSVGNIVDQVVRSVGAHGGSGGRSLLRVVENNPLPVILTGIGLAWLVVSSNRPADEPLDHEDPEPWRGDPFAPDRAAVPPAAGPGLAPVPDPGPDVRNDPLEPGAPASGPIPGSIPGTRREPDPAAETDTRSGMREGAAPPAAPRPVPEPGAPAGTRYGGSRDV